MEGKDSYQIKVGIRVRPLMQQEKECGAQNIISTSMQNNSGRISSKKTGDSFIYDWAFDHGTDQRTIYAKMCRHLIKDLFCGFNATFLAYGQTGSGKTHTMGTSSMQDGIIPYAMQDIFEKRNEITQQGGKVDITLSFIEIYLEECYDLLSKHRQQNSYEKTRLELRETSSGETALDGLSSWPVFDMASVGTYLSEAAKVRSTGTTAMNSQSSRSHAICTISVRVTLPQDQQNKENDNAPSLALVSKLHLVDLAGSERAKKTLASGEAFQEGVSINKGLLALGNVVAALASKNMATGHVHVPYRESKLTRLLKDSLGGNGMTVLLACISPADSNHEETINTLRFASRASSVVNKAKVNFDNSGNTETANLMKEVAALKLQLDDMHRKYTAEINSKQVSKGGNSNEDIRILVCSFLCRMQSVLATCLEDGVMIDPSDIAALQTDLSDARCFFRLPEQPFPQLKSAEQFEEDDTMSAVRTIMSIIQQMKDLRRMLGDSQTECVHGEEKPHAVKLLASYEELELLESDELLRQTIDGLEMDDQMFCDDSHLHEDDDEREGDDEQKEAISLDSREADSKEDQALRLKEAEIDAINLKSTEFAASIDQLNSDIAALRLEQQKLLSKHNKDSSSLHPSSSHTSQNAIKRPLSQQSSSIPSTKSSFGPSGGSNSIEDLKIKRELKEKSRLLEEKMKALRIKEGELSKITSQKEKLSGEVMAMRTVVDAQKKQRVDMQKKMREDNATFQNEKLKLKNSEIQSKRREMLAQQSLNKLGNQLMKKEMVWKGQLDAMERQSKLLREKLLRKEQVQLCKKTIVKQQEQREGADLIKQTNSNVMQLIEKLAGVDRDRLGLLSQQLSDSTEANVVSELLTNMACLREKLLQGQVSTRRKNKDGTEEEEEDVSQLEEDTDALDETFYPSDEERLRLGQVNPPRRGTEKHRNSGGSNGADTTSEAKDDMDGEDRSREDRDRELEGEKKPKQKLKRPAVGIIAPAATKKKVKLPKSVEDGPPFPFDLSIQKPLNQYTVKELKVFLKDRGLSVSGVKEDLISRLESSLFVNNATSEVVSESEQRLQIEVFGGAEEEEVEGGPQKIDSAEIKAKKRKIVYDSIKQDMRRKGLVDRVEEGQENMPQHAANIQIYEDGNDLKAKKKKLLNAQNDQDSSLNFKIMEL